MTYGRTPESRERIDPLREAIVVHDEVLEMRTHADEVSAQNKRLIQRNAFLEKALAEAQEQLQRGSAWLRMRAWIVGVWNA